MIRVKAFLHPASGGPAAEIGDLVIWNERRFPGSRLYSYKMQSRDIASLRSEGGGVRCLSTNPWMLVRNVLVDASTGPAPCAETVAQLEGHIRQLQRYVAALEEEHPDGIPQSVTDRLDDPGFFPELRT